MVPPAPRHVRVFISSPGDVAAERDLAQDVVLALGRSQAWAGKFTVETWRSDDVEAPFVLDARVPPQVGFEREGRKASECDIAVVILWSRLGTPLATPRRSDGTQYGSGTEYEFESALSNPRTRVLLYRRLDEPLIPLRASDIEERKRQLAAVDEFFRRFEGDDRTLRGGYRTYRGLDEFSGMLKAELEGILRSLEVEGRASAVGSVDARGARQQSGHYFSVQRELIAQHASGFVGREPAHAALQSFLTTFQRGYFIVEGYPGEGKTAFACHLVASHGYVHHFVSVSGGRADVRLILCSLLEQLSTLSDTPIDFDQSLPELSKIFVELLASVATREGRVVIVVDALDQFPSDIPDQLPFFPSDSLPTGVYNVVTSRPGTRLDRLKAALAGISTRSYALGLLNVDDLNVLLSQQNPGATEQQSRQLFAVSGGNALYAKAAITELSSGCLSVDVGRTLDLDAYFARQVGDAGRNSVLQDVLGVLAAAHRPLALTELAEVTGYAQRRINEEGISPIRHLLQEIGGHLTFYHELFREYVTARHVYPDELRNYHSRLAAWLMRSDSRYADDRWKALARHLFESGDHEALLRLIDTNFLAGKLHRFGYAVLEDIDLLARALLDGGQPGAIDQCMEMLDQLRAVGGDEVAREASRALRFGAAGSLGKFERPRLETIPSVDIDALLVPKDAVTADFVAVVPVGDRIALFIGDAPATGLKSAFVARFMASLVARRLQKVGVDPLRPLFDDLRSIVRAHSSFDRITMFGAVLAPDEGRLTMVNAGHPFPVLYSARRERADRLCVRGDPLATHEAEVPWNEERHCELGEGDALLLVSDGVTEASRLDDAYGYRFKLLVEQHRFASARSATETVLASWTAHARPPGYIDDATLMAAIIQPRGRH